MQPVKAKYRKLKDSQKLYETTNYYISQADFEDRNPTLFFDSLTKKTKPIPKPKKDK